MQTDMWLDLIEAAMLKFDREPRLAYAALAGALSVHVNDTAAASILQTLKQGA